MPQKITSTIELNDTAETKGLFLDRVSIELEEAKSEKDSRILGMDYPSGILIF